MERRYFGFSSAEGARLGGLFGVIALLHVVAWGLFVHYSGDFGPVYAGAGALAYGLGLRHAFDADHISAIDDSTRYMLQRGKQPVGTGFFFSLGHSTIVILLSVGLAFAARTVLANLDGWHAIGGIVGAAVSATFLWIVGLLNLIVFVGILRTYLEMRRGEYDPEHLEALLAQRGFMNRMLGQRYRNLITESWHLYPVGVLFGLGFDTATEVGLLAVTAGAASAAFGDSASVLPVFGIIALPLLFTAGMSLMDTIDGALMSKAYRWALSTPLRKVYYNLTTTGLSVGVALAVGTVEYAQAIVGGFRISNPFLHRLTSIDFEAMGYGIVGMSILTWAVSAALFKLRHVEERSGGSPGDRASRMAARQDGSHPAAVLE